MLKGKKALITGGSRGIGMGIASAFVENGAQVVITGRNMEMLSKACEELGGSAAKPLLWDSSDAHIARDKIAEAAALIGGLDIVVNNAGSTSRGHGGKGGFFELTVEEWDYIDHINLRGVYFICQAAAQYMIANGVRGHILNIGSETSYGPATNIYCITKWGVRGLTEGLGIILAPKGIVVNGIAPGPVATQMMNWSEGDSIERLSQPNGRFGLPEEIGDLAVFLTCGKGDSIVGQCVLCDGGHSLTRCRDVFKI